MDAEKLPPRRLCVDRVSAVPLGLSFWLGFCLAGPGVVSNSETARLITESFLPGNRGRFDGGPVP